MTLITRLRTKNWIIIAGDNQVNTNYGWPKKNGGKTITTCKLFLNKNIIGGLAGFIGDNATGYTN